MHSQVGEGRVPLCSYMLTVGDRAVPYLQRVLEHGDSLGLGRSGSFPSVVGAYIMEALV